MGSRKEYLDPPEEISKRIESHLRVTAQNVAELPVEFVQQLVFELLKQYIQLQMQNEELRNTEKKLQATRDSYHDLYDFAPIGYLTLNSSGYILEANLMVAKLLGVKRNSLIQSEFLQFIAPSDVEKFQKHYEQVFNSDTSQTCELQIIQSNQQKIYIVLESIASYHKETQEKQCRTVLSNITDRKLAEKKLCEADQRKNDFLALLSHELRNPLTPIINALHIMRLAQGNMADLTKAQNIIERQVSHMVRLIDDLLDVSRITRGKITLKKEWIELATVVNTVLEAIQPLIEMNGQQFKAELPLEPIFLLADPTRLAQILFNLLQNASKFTPTSGYIWFIAEKGENDITFRVRDTGIGIPKHMLTNIFDMFTQVDSSIQRSQSGLGIGLALTKRLVEMQGGTITAYSEGINKGSEFLLRLPALRQSNHGHWSQAKSIDPHKNVPLSSRILLVDDNKDVTESLNLWLSLMGHKVRSVNDGESAIQEALHFQPEVVLLDIGMPGMDGYHVAQCLRHEFSQKKIFIVAMTGWCKDEDRLRAKESGFDYHLTKPTTPREIQDLLILLQAKDNPILSPEYKSLKRTMSFIRGNTFDRS